MRRCANAVMRWTRCRMGNEEARSSGLYIKLPAKTQISRVATQMLPRGTHSREVPTPQRSPGERSRAGPLLRCTSPLSLPVLGSDEVVCSPCPRRAGRRVCLWHVESSGRKSPVLERQMHIQGRGCRIGYFSEPCWCSCASSGRHQSLQHESRVSNHVIRATRGCVGGGENRDRYDSHSDMSV